MKGLFLTAVAFGSLAIAGIAAPAAAGEPAPVLTFAQAKEIQAKAEKIISDHHMGGVVTVVDASGQMITFDRLDGAKLANGALAPKKAHTAVAFGAPTDSWGQKLAQGNTAILGNPEIVPLPGGVPITIGGTLAGAVGVSTPDGNVDLEAAKGAITGF